MQREVSWRIRALVQTHGVQSTGERERRGERRVQCGTLLGSMVSGDAYFTIPGVPGVASVRDQLSMTS